MFNQADELTGIPKEAAFNELEIYVSSKPQSTSFSDIHQSYHEEDHTEALSWRKPSMKF